MELQLTRNYSIFHQGVGKNLPNGIEEIGPKGHGEKRFRAIGQERFLVSTPAQDGFSRNGESIYPVAGLRKQLEI